MPTRAQIEAAQRAAARQASLAEQKHGKFIIEATKEVVLNINQTNFKAANEGITQLIKYLDENKAVVTLDVYRALSPIWHELRTVSNHRSLDQSSVEKLGSMLQQSYDDFTSLNYGFPVVALEAKVGLGYDMLPLFMANADKNLEQGAALMPTYGDNNCGPRAIIQSLLLRGVTTGRRQDVIAFLEGIFERQSGTLLKAAEEPNTKVIETLNRMEFDAFCEAYMSDTLDLDVFIRTYFSLMTAGKVDKPHHDKVCYFLAACLRFDIATELRDGPPTEAGVTQYELEQWEGRDMFELQTELNLGAIRSYFPNHNLQLAVSVANQSVPDPSKPTIKKFTEWGISSQDQYSSPPGEGYLQLDINQGSNHFEVRVMPSLDGLARRAHLQAERSEVAVKASGNPMAGAGAGCAAPKSAHDGFFKPTIAANPKPAEDTIDWSFYLKCLSGLAMVSGGAMLVVGLLLPLPGLAIAGACLLAAGVVGYASSHQGPEDDESKASSFP